MKYWHGLLIMALSAVLFGACSTEVASARASGAQPDDLPDELRARPVQSVDSDYSVPDTGDTAAPAPRSAPNMYPIWRAGDAIFHYTAPQHRNL